MNIEELRKARREMEIAIRESAQKAMSQFRERTGMSPRSVTIHLDDVTQMGDTERTYAVIDVHCHIEV